MKEIMDNGPVQGKQTDIDRLPPPSAPLPTHPLSLVYHSPPQRERERERKRERERERAVSYTHLTLPTKLSV